ncbi:MAG: lipoyl(octanoyl) transferase LipB [Phycisphaera sp.]|nr:lipoyl(octanoyl) transferase LipB [Phycisphaera sp.]
MHTDKDVKSVKILRAVDLGRLPYAQVYELQLRHHAQVVAGAANTLLLVEHEPVVTVTRRKDAGDHVLMSRELLAQRGIDIQETDRGGDVTYHGPGQLVAYPILRMNDYQLNVGRFMRLLEQAVIDTVATWGVVGKRLDKATGVWVDLDGATDQQPAKLAALGIRVVKGVTLHGVALNVTTDLTHFQTIIPCGLSNTNVTSLSVLLGDSCPAMEQVKLTFADRLQQLLNTRPTG